MQPIRLDLYCAHCGTPVRKTAGGYCTDCTGPVCSAAACLHGCPRFHFLVGQHLMERKSMTKDQIERAYARARFHQAAGLVLR